MRTIRDDDFYRLEKIKARLHLMRVTETGGDNFRRLTSSIADLDQVLLNAVPE
jgi:hypothetical protein